MLAMSERAFQVAVRDAVKMLPDKIRERLKNITIVVKNNPSVEETGPVDADDALFGLYEGEGLFPDRITVYRKPLLEHCRTRDELLREIRLTVIHEVGHYFGLSDEDLP